MEFLHWWGVAALWALVVVSVINATYRLHDLGDSRTIDPEDQIFWIIICGVLGSLSAAGALTITP